ncbi:MAG TPA: hypothetical protein VF735_05300 [Pyrinomonadaceae bacterium]|jgi:hypothetical protein
MNCQEFERTVFDLARETLSDATQRAHGLAHAEACESCAARLASERSLTVGLRSLATSMRETEAPQRVETALLSAFRERDKVIQFRPIASPLHRAGLGQWRWAASLAAGLALLFVALAAIRLQQPPPAQPPSVATARDSKPLKLASWPSLEDEKEPAVLTPARGQQPAFQRVSNRTRNSLSVINRGGGTIEKMPLAGTAANTAADDIATDFIPLTYGADLSSLDSGHVVRVELPRTAMARFGLPVNAERAAEPVKADVLLGDDGLAQAIRFIR